MLIRLKLILYLISILAITSYVLLEETIIDELGEIFQMLSPAIAPLELFGTY